MINRLFIILLTLITKIAFAQEFPSELWHNGMVVLVNEDTISGKIKYNLKQGFIQIKLKDKVFNYSGKRIFYFQIFDKTVGVYREFYTLPYALINQYESPVFFEVLVEGKLTLLCREAIMTKTINDTSYNPYGSTMNYSRDVLVYTYYFLDNKGTITKYSKKKRDLLKALSKRASKIEEYMKINHLKADNRNDLSRIISFYNGIL